MASAFSTFNHVLRRRTQNLRWFSSPPQAKPPERILSGIQPTGVLHIGNYYGAVRNLVESQNEGKEVILGIVDLHSITLPKEPKYLKDSILSMTASLLACGANPEKCILFQQSRVPQHTQFAWVLGCLTTMTRLAHFPQYKEKSAGLIDVPLGLFTYPVLQAADILLYKATHVPVGQDQVQHIHLAQHLVHTFNNKFGKLFPFPEVVLQSGKRIKSLKDPTKKMSKSHEDSKSRIDITDSPDEISRKIKKAMTDFTSKVTYDPELRPGVSNLIDLHCLATGKSQREICEENSHLDTGKYKLIVADAVVNVLDPIRREVFSLLDSPDYLESVLKSGSDKAEEIAENTWSEVRKKVGFDIARRKKNYGETKAACS